MSQDTPFLSFISFIDFDRTVYEKESQIESKKQEIVALHNKNLQLDEQLIEAKKVVHDTKKVVDEKELEMKVLDEQEAEKKQRLNMVTTQKEYQSIKHEFDNIVEKQLSLENVLVIAWNQLELVQKKYAEQESLHQEKIQHIHDAIVQVESEIRDILMDLEEQKKVRDTKKERVPEEWLEKYAMMRSRVVDPVVPVDDGSCSGCYHMVTDQELIALKRNKLLQCKGCYRFMYQAPPT